MYMHLVCILKCYQLIDNFNFNISNANNFLKIYMCICIYCMYFEMLSITLILINISKNNNSLKICICISCLYTYCTYFKVMSINR